MAAASRTINESERSVPGIELRTESTPTETRPKVSSEAERPAASVFVLPSAGEIQRKQPTYYERLRLQRKGY